MIILVISFIAVALHRPVASLVLPLGVPLEALQLQLLAVLSIVLLHVVAQGSRQFVKREGWHERFRHHGMHGSIGRRFGGPAAHLVEQDVGRVR